MKARAVGFVLILIGSVGCAITRGHTVPQSQGHYALLVIAPEKRLVLYALSGGEGQEILPALSGTVIDARLDEAGRPAVLSCRTSAAGDDCSIALYESGDTGEHPILVLGTGSYQEIVALHKSGRRVAAEHRLDSTHVRIDLLDGIGQPPQQLINFRLAWNGSIREDGAELLIGGIDGACTSNDLDRCRIVMARISLSENAPVVEALPELCAAYQPIYDVQSRDSVIFQGSFGVGPGCPTSTNEVPLSILRWSAAAGTQVIRHRAIGPTPSADGRYLAWLAYPSTCARVPCPVYEVEVTRVDKPAERRLVGIGNILHPRFFSPDARWLAVGQTYVGMKDWSWARAAVLPLSGEAAPKVIGIGKIVGWK